MPPIPPGYPLPPLTRRQRRVIVGVVLLLVAVFAWAISWSAL